MKRVILYIRVSTQEQVDGYSISAQKDRLISYCQALDLVIVDIIVDAGFSGSNLDRPGIQSVISMVKNGETDSVLVYKLDRLSRSQKDTLFLIEDVFLPARVHFISMQESFDTSTPFGIAMVGILSVFAQLERSNIQERTFSGRVERAKGGLWHGGGYDPIGYDYVDGKLQINTEEASQVRRVFELYASGASITAIRDRMVELGFETKYGPWVHTNTVISVLDNPLYAGTVHFDGSAAPDSHPAIVSQSLFDKVSALRSRSKSNRAVSHSSSHLLTGFVFCSYCGARYFPKKNKAGNVYYCCHSRAKVNRAMVVDPSCKNQNWRKSALEDYVARELFRVASDPVAALDIHTENKKTTGDGGFASADVSRLDEEIKAVMNLYKSDHVPVAAVSEQIKSLYAQKSALSSLAGIPASPVRLQNGIPANVRLLLNDLPSSWHSWGLDYQRHVLRQLISGIYIDGGNVHITWSW